MADRARDPESLEREIERTRSELARTIDELADRVNPRNVAQRGAERLKEEAGQVAKTVRSMTRTAEPDDDDVDGGVDRRLLLAGAGVAVGLTALMLWRRRRRR